MTRPRLPGGFHHKDPYIILREACRALFLSEISFTTIIVELNATIIPRYIASFFTNLKIKQTNPRVNIRRLLIVAPRPATAAMSF